MKRGEACRVTAAVVPNPFGQTDTETPPSGNDASRSVEYYDLELLCWTGTTYYSGVAEAVLVCAIGLRASAMVCTRATTDI